MPIWPQEGMIDGGVAASGSEPLFHVFFAKVAFSQLKRGTGLYICS